MRPIRRSLILGLASLSLSALTLPVWGADPKPAAKAEIKEPAEADIQRLYRERIDSVNQGSVKFLGTEGAQKVLIKLEGLKKTECRTQEKGVYVCGVFVDSAIGNGRMETRRLTLTLVKDGDNWRLK